MLTSGTGYSTLGQIERKSVAGVHRVVTSDGGALADAGAYAHHGSLAYGAARHAATRVVASCSFYDREVHLWRDG